MRRKRTTRTKSRDRFVHHIKVQSPRIVLFQIRDVLLSVLKFASLVAVLALVVWGGRIGWHQLVVTNEEFLLEELQLTTNGKITHERIVEAGGIDPTGNIFAVDLEDLEKRLEALPEVVSAEAFRRPPGIIRVELKERVPIAWIECASLGVRGRDPVRGLLLDSEGMLFACDPEAGNEVMTLPVICLKDGKRDELGPGEYFHDKLGKRALALMNSVKEMQDGYEDFPMPDRIRVRSEYSLEGSFPSGTDVVFGLYDHERQLEDLVKLWQHADAQDQFLAKANLMPKRNIPVELVPLNY